MKGYYQHQYQKAHLNNFNALSNTHENENYDASTHEQTAGRHRQNTIALHSSYDNDGMSLGSVEVRNPETQQEEELLESRTI